MRTGTWLTLLVLIVLCAPVFARAGVFRAGEDVGIRADERFEDDLYLAAGQLLMEGRVAGDLLAAGGSVDVGGETGADLFAVGGNVSVLGDVGDDARVAGGDVVIRGRVGGDLLALGGQVRVLGGVGGDATIGAGTLRLDAPVSGSVRIAAGRAFLNAPIEGDVYFTGEELVLGSGARIGGSIEYSAPKELVRESGALIEGGIEYSDSGTRKRLADAAKAGAIAFLSLWFIAKTLGILISALAIGLIFRRFSSEVVSHATARTLAMLGRGFVAILVLPVASVILLVSLVGIPLGVIGLASTTALLVFASLVTPVVLGSAVHKIVAKPAEYRVDWLTILVGTLVYIVLGFIPVVGWLVIALAMLATLGAIVKILLSSLDEWR